VIVFRIFGHQDFTSARETGYENLVTNSPDIITVGDGFLVPKLYAM